MGNAIVFGGDPSPTTPVRLGIDEVAVRGELYTTIMDVDRGTVVTIFPGNSARTIRVFLRGLPRPEAVKVVSVDLIDHYIDAIRESLPDTTIEIDRYFVESLLQRCVGWMRIEVGQRLLTAEPADQSAFLHLGFCPQAGAEPEGELRTRVKKLVDSLHRDRQLFELPYERLDPAERIKLEFWLARLPLLHEVYDLWQKVHRLYDTDTDPETAGALLNQWFDDLSAQAARCLRCREADVRARMSEVCAYWATHFN